jgi:hypothetical protein
MTSGSVALMWVPHGSWRGSVTSLQSVHVGCVDVVDVDALLG